MSLSFSAVSSWVGELVSFGILEALCGASVQYYYVQVVHKNYHFLPSSPRRYKWMAQKKQIYQSEGVAVANSYTLVCAKNNCCADGHRNTKMFICWTQNDHNTKTGPMAHTQKGFKVMLLSNKKLKKFTCGRETVFALMPVRCYIVDVCFKILPRAEYQLTSHTTHIQARACWARSRAHNFCVQGRAWTFYMNAFFPCTLSGRVTSNKNPSYRRAICQHSYIG